MSLILITGGARSGKSTWAERRAAELAAEGDGAVFYIATAEVKDMEMRLRVAHHRRNRPRSWKTIEAPRGVASTLLGRGKIPVGSLLLLECVTMLASNLMTAGEEPLTDPDEATEATQRELRAILRIVKEREATIIMVTNEVNAGIVPENELARNYREVVGRINQWLAAQATEIWHIVSGMALPLHTLATPVRDNSQQES